jgi:hypothetical protein
LALQEFVLCRADHNRQRLKGFYLEDGKSLDVVVLGASEAYSDFAPGHAYNKCGVTGYVFATASNSILNYKSQLKNILSRQNPDVIVIELNGALYGDEEEAVKEANLRNYADNVPLDGVKLEWLGKNARGNLAEYLCPIIKYHGTWTDFPGEMKYQRTIIRDRLRGYNYLKGILNETTVFKNTQRSMNDALAASANSKKPLTKVEEDGLRDLLEFCRDENLKNVVFARFPHIVVRRTFSRFERSNTVGDIVAEYGFDYLNFERDYAQTGLDETKDFYNLDHLNVYGQRKFTDYVTDILKKNYGAAPRDLTQSQKDEWQACAAAYDAYYSYSDGLIKSGDRRELSEDEELLKALKIEG